MLQACRDVWWLGCLSQVVDEAVGLAYHNALEDMTSRVAACKSALQNLSRCREHVTRLAQLEREQAMDRDGSMGGSVSRMDDASSVWTEAR